MLQEKLRNQRIDVTLPGRPISRGTKHPLTLIIEQIEDIFTGLGFEIAEGPEMETDYYNFEALEPSKGSSSPGYAGHLLYYRGYFNANPYIAEPSSSHGG